jgi:hypothetical protein
MKGRKPKMSMPFVMIAALAVLAAFVAVNCIGAEIIFSSFDKEDSPDSVDASWVIGATNRLFGEDSIFVRGKDGSASAAFPWQDVPAPNSVNVHFEGGLMTFSVFGHGGSSVLTVPALTSSIFTLTLGDIDPLHSSGLMLKNLTVNGERLGGVFHTKVKDPFIGLLIDLSGQSAVFEDGKLTLNPAAGFPPGGGGATGTEITDIGFEVFFRGGRTPGMLSFQALGFNPQIAVPEPSTMTLAALGLASFIGREWHRRRRQ